MTNEPLYSVCINIITDPFAYTYSRTQCTTQTDEHTETDTPQNFYIRNNLNMRVLCAPFCSGTRMIHTVLRCSMLD